MYRKKIKPNTFLKEYAFSISLSKKAAKLILGSNDLGSNAIG